MTFFVISGVTGNLPTPKYTKSYASSTIAVTVFAGKTPQLYPKTSKNSHSSVGRCVFALLRGVALCFIERHVGCGGLSTLSIFTHRHSRLAGSLFLGGRAVREPSDIKMAKNMMDGPVCGRFATVFGTVRQQIAQKTVGRCDVHHVGSGGVFFGGVSGMEISPLAPLGRDDMEDTRSVAIPWSKSVLPVLTGNPAGVEWKVINNTKC